MDIAQNRCGTGRKESPRPDAGGEGLDGVEAEIFVELDGGAVVRRYGKR